MDAACEIEGGGVCNHTKLRTSWEHSCIIHTCLSFKTGGTYIPEVHDYACSYTITLFAYNVLQFSTIQERD